MIDTVIGGVASADARTRTPCKTAGITTHTPLPVDDVTVEPPPSGVTVIAVQLVPSIVPSNWAVPVHVPASWMPMPLVRNTSDRTAQAVAVVQSEPDVVIDASCVRCAMI